MQLTTGASAGKGSSCHQKGTWKVRAHVIASCQIQYREYQLWAGCALTEDTSSHAGAAANNNAPSVHEGVGAHSHMFHTCLCKTLSPNNKYSCKRKTMQRERSGCNDMGCSVTDTCHVCVSSESLHFASAMICKLDTDVQSSWCVMQCHRHLTAHDFTLQYQDL